MSEHLASHAQSKSPSRQNPAQRGLLQRASRRSSEYGESLSGSIRAALASPGRPLEPQLRDFMGASFGYDFSRVRVHTGVQAARSAREVNALAYTAGQHVVFDSGYYAPQTTAGRHLLAHELAHVVQQSQIPSPGPQRYSLDPAGSSSEREAGQAVRRIAAGEPANVSPVLIVAGELPIQRAEKGTYVSTVVNNPGDKDYLDAGFNFFSRWGYPNVKRVATMKDVLDDLDTSTSTIEKFRIVSHGSSVGLQIGLLPEVAPDYFYKETAELTTPKSFRERFTGTKLLSDSAITGILNVLRKDATAKTHLATIGVGTDTPDENSDLGIVLRAMLEQSFIDHAKDQNGNAVTIANKGLLDQFNTSRINTYRPLVINTFPAAERQKVTQAFADLKTSIETLVNSGKITFGAISQQEADTLADPFIEDIPKGTGKRLRAELTRSMQEGTDGAFLKKLRSVRGKVDTKTRIEIRGCNVGANTATMDAIRGFFGNTGALPSITAPDLFQYFFPLGLTAYGTTPQEETKLQTEYADPTTGLATRFDQGERIRRNEMILVSNESKLDEVATKYGKTAVDLRRLNPEISDPNHLAAQDTVWFVQRTSLQAGTYKTLQDFCAQYLGDAKAIDAVKAANPQIKDPNTLTSGDKISVPNKLLKSPFADVTPPTAQQFSAAIRGGQAVVAFGQDNRPKIHLDVTKKEAAIGAWLAQQHFDPTGKTAAALSALYTVKDFPQKVAGTYVAFLSKSYPNVVDPIFPDDPRYDKHIISRP